jgi:hypothetical protein
MQLLDAHGRLVQEQQLLPTIGNNYVIDVTDLPPGMYHVVIIHHEQLQTIEKLVIMQ